MVGVQLWWDPRQRLPPGQLGVREKNPFARALRESPLQGSCDFGLIECISKWLENSEDGTHCTGFRDISIAGLGTRHRRIQCMINCKHEIQQGSCSLETQTNPPWERSATLSKPQKNPKSLQPRVTNAWRDEGGCLGGVSMGAGESPAPQLPSPLHPMQNVKE